jgi:uncharacterized membrane protein YgcG
MVRSNRLAVAGVVLVGAAVAAGLVATRDSAAQPRPEQWKKVDDAVRKGLPKTAIQELEPIIASALKDKAYPEAIKAVCQKINLEGNIQGNKPEEKVVRLKAAIATAPAEMHPVMHAVLAHWYWHYFQQNRWRIVQRTAAGDTTGDDVTTWDLPRILTEIDRQFDRALAADKELKETPVARYDILLEKGTIGDDHRPTLYDVLAFDALGFYAANEHNLTKAEDAFEIPADSPVFAPIADFLKWRPQTTDTGSRVLKAVRLYQAVLAFHHPDANLTARLDADLHRLRFGHTRAVGDKKTANYIAALDRFAEENANHPLSALARSHWARAEMGRGDRVKARQIALAGTAAFPDSPGGKLCHNVVAEIEAKGVEVKTERVWADPRPDVRVTYRNLTRVHFRLVKADFAARLQRSQWRPEQMNQNEQDALLKLRPELEFARDLPPTPDYQERTESFPAPKGVAPGFYFLIASPDAGFGGNNNVVSFTDVWVSDLAIVTRQEHGSLAVGGFVLKGNAGTPVEGAKVRAWLRRPNGGWEQGPEVATDRNGMYSLTGKQQHGVLVVARHEDDALATAHDAFLFQHDFRERPSEHVTFFTDRSLYRPGQTIQFRGVCFRTDTAADKYEAVPNRDITVVLRDVNGQEVAKLPCRTNEYGSFSGSFTAPRDRLTGQMTILTLNGPPGGVALSVEEYKRPKFLVTTEAPREPAKLGAEVKVPGKATAYTGAAIGGAKVKYRVVREVRYPAWFHEFCWWRPVPRQPAQEIAHGVVTTEADGTFTVPFTAAPDASVPEADEPTFRFTVTAEVTDGTGETRVGTQSVEVGYVALRATVAMGEWQTADAPVKLTVGTTSLDGVGREATGAVKVYRLKTPARPARGGLPGDDFRPYPLAGAKAPPPDPSKPASWEPGEIAHIGEFKTDGKGKAELDAKLAAGIYRVVVETRDPFGKAVTGKAQLLVLAPAADKLAVPLPNVVAAPKWTVEPGGLFTVYWGTGYDAGRAFVEVEHRGKILHAFWTDPAKTQATFSVPVTEGMRGGFTVRTTYVRENRAHLVSRHVDVPWSNKQLNVKWETFRNKLEPGKRETFTAVITGPDAKRAAAEMAATLYDKSLDAYRMHQWDQRIGHHPSFQSRIASLFENVPRHLHHLHGGWAYDRHGVVLTYRGMPSELTTNYMRYEYFGTGGGGAWQARDPALASSGFAMDGASYGGRGGAVMPAAAAPPGMMADARRETDRAAGGVVAEGATITGQRVIPGGPDLGKVVARTNLNETAFFFPHLTAGPDGVVRLEFTMPEALTTWKFMGIAHDRDLRSGFISDELVTAKDLMAQPNPPRFLREGDVIEYPVKVSNTSPTRQQGKVRLSVRDARTDAPLDAELGIAGDQTFDLPAGESKTFAWKLTVPDGVGPLAFKAVAASDRHSDGEEGVIPVLSKRVLVTESLPLPIRGAGTKEFDFVRLRNSAGSTSIRHQSFTIQMVSQPAWYAVMALPYLMEYPHECSEQTFNRLYANGLARHVANSDPRIRRVFDLWKNTPALDSPLEKNADLKSVLLEETPWVRQAVKEGQARRNVGVLFDANRLDAETVRLNRRMAEMQYPDGMWPWFPGGRPNEYITLYVVTGYGRMRHLGVKQDVAPAVKAVTALDGWMDQQYRQILRHGNPDANHLSPTVAMYLYGRSFFLADRPVANEHRPAWEYWLGQAKRYWLALGHRQSQAHLAVALKRTNDLPAARGIMASIKERSVSNEEMGMFWRDLELQQFWFRAPIETQAMMIEAFDEVMNDAQAVEDCKVWLLKQKQTQDWKTTKATADAVYALLLRGDNLLKSDALVEVTVGNRVIAPQKVEAGTGFYEEKFLRTEVQPSMAAITLKKADKGVSWGSAHWSYLEDMDKVTAAADGPLKLEKRLFRKLLTKQGPKLDPFAREPLAVGDEVVVRLVLRTDRDMEYVHLKDHRGSGTEPTNVLSRYRFQDGLAYYESTKDVATHFFIDYLPKGNYVFEYPVRAQHRGRYGTGFAAIQCLYAPEFNSHSESLTLDVR